MSLCTEYIGMEELQDRAQLYGESLRDWQAHLQACATCTEQHHAVQELRFGLAGQAAPRLDHGFPAAVLQRARATQGAASPQPRLSPRTRMWLALNWVSIALGCITLAGTIHPAENFQRNPALVLPAMFILAVALLAIPIRRNAASRRPSWYA